MLILLQRGSKMNPTEEKMATDNIEPISRQQTAIPLQRQWPQLGRELYSLERALAAHFVTYGHTLSENEKMERAERFRNRVFAQRYNDDEKYSPVTRYRAFLLVKHTKLFYKQHMRDKKPRFITWVKRKRNMSGKKEKQGKEPVERG